MRTGAAAGHDGYYHEALCYHSDNELLAVAVPFLLDGAAAGEPTVVVVGERTAALVRAALPAGPAVSFLAGGDLYARPTSALRSIRELLASYVADGAQQVRILGEVPQAALGAMWDWWARYESAVNHAYAEFPVWGLCPYDTRVTPASVLEDVARTHPRVTTSDARRLPNETYTDPMVYLRENRPMVPDPIQQAPPTLELTNPSPAQARSAVYAADRGRLPADDVEDLVIAVSETVTNAHRHGLPPIKVRFWSGEDRVVVTVSDGGDGPKDPFIGLLPAATGSAGGLGLWITYQSCNHVAMHRDSDAFTLRLTAGRPHSLT